MDIKKSVTDFLKLSSEKKHELFQQIWMFDQQVFPTSNIESLKQFIYDADAFSVLIIQYFYKGNLIGQNIIVILMLNLGVKKVSIVTSRAGFLPEYRHRNLTLKGAVWVALQHRLRYPTHQLWFVTTLMQPQVYTLFASRAYNFYPRHHRHMPIEYGGILEIMRARKKHIEQRDKDVFVHTCDIAKISKEQLAKKQSFSDIHTEYFMQHVPDYFNGKGMMCICRLSFKTIFAVSMNLAFDRRII